MDAQKLKSHVRTIRNWPQDGVNFRDITPLFQVPECFHAIVDVICDYARQESFNIIAGVDARGFILSGAVAKELHLPMALVRKKGKLPYHTLEESYELEYGNAAVEIHTDACSKGDGVLILDDLIATGGTLLASAKLFARAGAGRVSTYSIIDLPELQGSQKLRDQEIETSSIIQFSESE